MITVCDLSGTAQCYENQVVGDSLIEDTDDESQQEHFDFQGFDIRKLFGEPRFRDALSGWMPSFKKWMVEEFREFS